jgi:hypothetical protein
MASTPRVLFARGGVGPVVAPVPGAISISVSVGSGGKNKRNDTRGVQVALNAVPASLGGAGESLKVDGLVGPLTIGAISTFQQRWLTVHDSRCDPSGPTLALLNAMAGVGDALPPGTATLETAKTLAVTANQAPVAARPSAPRRPTAAELVLIKAAEERQFVVERHHMWIVKRWLINALRVNDAAQAHAISLTHLAHGATIAPAALASPERRAFLLVAKTFKLHERDATTALAGTRRVDLILRQSMLIVAARVPRPPVVSPAPPSPAPLFISLFGRPASVPPSVGYTVSGGLHLGPGPAGRFNPFIIPGQVIPERMSRIYLPPDFDDQNPDLQRLTLIHELAHFVGSPDGQRGTVKEFGTVDRPAAWKRLNSFKRLNTAESFAFFATECNIGTVDSVSRSNSTMDAIGEWPKVTSNTFATRDDVAIELPPAGNPEAAKFAFPAGFS